MMEMTAINNLKGRLKREILKTGYPLEIEVASILEDFGWAAFPNHFYVDPTSNKPREIDIFGFSEATSSDKSFDPIAFSPHLIIECKKSLDYSLVVFSRKRSAFTFYDITGQIYDFPVILGRVDHFPNPREEFNLSYFLTRPQLHYNQFERIASTYTLIKPGVEKGKSDIFEAVMQIMKAQSFDVKEAIKRDKTITHTHYPLYLSFLAIVFDGLIFEAEIEQGEVNLKEAEHMLLHTTFQPNYSDFPLYYSIDLVKKENFKNYLQQLRDDISMLKEHIKSNAGNVSKYLKRDTGVLIV
jgi:hypothetical protein